MENSAWRTEMFWSLFDKSNQLVNRFYWLFHLQPQEVSQNHQIKYLCLLVKEQVMVG